jgi:UDP-N-acetylglucosamine 4,6-dehydratase/UDP-glucose 4-epimerase
MKIEKNKTYLITGATGFLGEHLVEKIINDGGKVRAFSRNEGKLIMIKQKHPEIEIFTGDVSDKFEMKQAMMGVDAVFHLAASKHVGLAETYSRECTKTNIMGSLNILENSLEQELDFVIGISTDKAAQVSGVYGATKLLMERLFLQFQNINPSVEYRIVRYGNVLYSTGSVLCKWKELLEEGKQVIITDPDATRFFWTRNQAVDLIFSCLSEATSPSPWVPDMKSMKMGDLLTAMSNKYLPSGKELDVKIIGLQRGENMHEKILEEGPASNEVEQFTIEEIQELI